MIFEKVLLITPHIPHSQYLQGVAPEAGLGYVAHALGKSGVEYDVLDMSLGYKPRDLFRKIDTLRPDLLGISLKSYQHRASYNLLTEIKEKYPQLAIVAGGPHISTLREQAVLDCPSIDFGVVLEGDETIVELCKGKELKKIKGILYRDKGDVFFTGERSLAEDLDKIGFPEYGHFELVKYLEPMINIVSSRGCPYKCIFCPVKTAIGEKFRARSAQSVVEEIIYWYGRGYRKFDIVDDNFTLDKRRVVQFCDLVGKLNYQDVILNLPNGIRADRVDFEVLKKMKKAGFKHIAFGVESANPDVLKGVEKGESIEVVEEAIEGACKLGFEVALFFVIGLPGDNRQRFEESLEFAQKYPVQLISFYNAIPFPQTKLCEWVAQGSYFIKPTADYLNNASHWRNEPIFATPDFSYKERKTAFDQAKKIAKKTWRRWLRNKGYSRLKKYGVLGKAVSWLYASAPVQWVMKRRRANQLKNYLRDRLQQVEPVVGKFEEVEPVSCNLCGVDSPKQIEEGSLSVVRCRNCGLVYVNPRPTVSVLNKYYSDDYYSDWFITQEKSKLPAHEKRLERVERYVRRGELLDVGAGLGIFLNLAKENGWEVYGTEVSDYTLADLQNSFGESNILSGSLEEVDISPETFDVVTLWHVLEHTTDPSSYVSEVRRTLKKNGLVFIAVPNINSLFLFFRKLLKRESQFYFSKETHEPHLYFFSPRTLKRIVEKAGFKIIENSTENPWLGLDVSWKLRVFIALTEVIYKVTRINVSDGVFICAKKGS